MPKKIRFMETILRDGQQSLIATRMPTSDMLPILSTLDTSGYAAIEMWGGATFDSCLRYLNENPFDRLRTLRRALPNSQLQMLLRGQNILGYKNYPDDVVETFVKKSVENGIDIIRIFDALNDPRNLVTALNACKKAGGKAQLAMSYTVSPVHTIDYFADLAVTYANLGADSLCIKDMAGVLMPDAAFELVSKIKARVNLPLSVHTHATCGIAEMTYLKAVEAGCDVIDTALSPFAGGTSQPATESLNFALTGLGYGTGLNAEKIETAATYFEKIRDKFRADGTLNPKVKDIQPKALRYKVPGGMLSNLLSQLKEQGLESRYEELLQEVPQVRADLGYPPLVTPLSQMVGTQALMNILAGQRYEMIPNEIKDYVKGLYGRPPAPINAHLSALILDGAEPLHVRPADLLPPAMADERAKSKYAKSTEDVLLTALFYQQGTDFLGRREDKFYDVPTEEISVQLD